jgi:hypothetical protein
VSSLSKFIALVIELADAIKALMLMKKKEDLKDAATESIDSKDQRPLESEVGVSSDNPSEYPGMFKRPRKKE